MRKNLLKWGAGMLCALAFVACSKDDDPKPEKPDVTPGDTTYVVKYTINDLGENYFAFGPMTATYVDAKGDTLTQKFDKYTEFPVVFTTTGWKKEGAVYFNLTHTVKQDTPIEDKTYVVERDVRLVIVPNTGATFITGAPFSLPVRHDRVLDYMNKHAAKVARFENTIENYYKR